MNTFYNVNKPVTLGVVVDAAKTNLSSAPVEVMDIPAGFVCDAVVVEELNGHKAGAAANLTVKAKTANVTLGKATSIGGSAEARKFYGASVTNAGGAGGSGTVEVSNSVALLDGDKMTIATSAAVSSGLIRVALIGKIALAPVPAEGEANVAVTDPLYA